MKHEDESVEETRERLRDKARHSGNILRVFFGSVFDHPDPTQEAVQRAGVTARAMEATSTWAARQRERAAYAMGLLQALEETARYGRDRFADVQEEAVSDLIGPDFTTDDEGETTVAGTTTTVTTKTTEVHLAETEPEAPMVAKEEADK